MANFSPNQKYLLKNSQFKFDSNLIGFEFYTIGSGPIKISLTTHDLNETLASWTINAVSGYNKIFNQFPLKTSKDSLIILEFVSSSKIALQKSSFYQDQAFNGTSYVPLDGKNFIFKALIDTGFYIGKINFTKQYDFATDYFLRIGSTERKYTVSNYKNMELICSVIKEYDANCYLSIISQTPDNFILAEYGTCENETISSNSSLFRSFFGPIIYQHESLLFNSNNKKYLITNNEFRYGTYLTGFEIVASKSGNVRIEVVYFSECGDLIPCSAYFKTTLRLSQYSDVFLNKTLILNTGLNKISIMPIWVKKGAVLVLSYLNSGRVAVSNATTFKTYSDYSIVENSLEELSKNETLVFMIKSMVQDGHFLDEISVIKTYPFYSTFYQKFKLASSTNNIKTTLDLIKSLIFDIDLFI